MKEKDDKKGDGKNDYYAEASRFTLAVLLVVLLIWAIYDWVINDKSGGFQWVLIAGTVIVLGVTRRYLIRKGNKK